ncbi:MAG: hypothetical protein K2L55_08855 [Muribaculaceae bacterium]|nr:hypothetical protein [Muribaculaceae bacterium]
MDFLNYNSVERLPGYEARAAFTVYSASVFREDVDIVPTIVDDRLSSRGAATTFSSSTGSLLLSLKTCRQPRSYFQNPLRQLAKGGQRPLAD